MVNIILPENISTEDLNFIVNDFIPYEIDLREKNIKEMIESIDYEKDKTKERVLNSAIQFEAHLLEVWKQTSAKAQREIQKRNE